MKLSKLLTEANIIPTESCEDVNIFGVCRDASLVGMGMLYIAIEGLHADGHMFLGEAARRGASAAVVSRAALSDGRVDADDLKIPCVAVEDTRIAAAYLFAAWNHNPQKQLRIVGITGTNGKTTVSTLIYEILRRSGERVGLIGTVGCQCSCNDSATIESRENAGMTTPDPEVLYDLLAKMRDASVDTVVMEVSSHALSLGRVAPICFDVAVFTNLTEDHLDLHGDMERYYLAKASLMKQCRRAVVNLDDHYWRRLALEAEIPVSTCSAEGRDARFSAEDVREKGILGIEYKISSRELSMRVRSPMPGRFNVMNTLEAAVTARLLGVSVGEIRETLSCLTGAKGRLERVEISEKVGFSVYIDYAHTPDALENLLKTVRSFLRRGERLVLLFGCGGDRDKLKRPIMGKIATLMADYVILTADNSRSEQPRDIIVDILRGVSEDASYTVIESRREAIEYAIRQARRGDLILLAGKGHEDYEIDRDGKKPFCEKVIVRLAVEKYFG